ncbi:hypothetical protein MON38_14815 [Hymenobacter sp. DH14]|uniref:Transglutaminase-like domain-containing protein n=1 Tax=Hymenobacter cyanobacteriorum TaxID=2926463 RepID=A0A9X1VH45_9BACT|nr:transglutaminase domain-containing protein [Hymenobacter cyanobacteriorum]MCI1188697.1 hypothetical protein [Hymenobacter cyanobacteriorum]
MLPLYRAVDARMRQVPDSAARTVGGLTRFIATAFQSEDERARAAFVWVARNIRYDVDNRYVLDSRPEHATTVQETMDQRRGVCQHYAELYSALANQAGVLTYVVPGYTSLRDPLGHAWCASRIAGQWWLMDPTWAAGHLANETFIPEFNDAYFRVAPAVFIATHMPFDPLWQLLPAPRTPQQFQLGTQPPAPDEPFAFADSVAAYARQSPEQQLRNIARRVEQNGVKNDLTFNFLLHNRQALSNQFVSTFNAAVDASNAGIRDFNAFIVFFNHRFLPHRSDEELQQLLVPVAAHLAKARRLLATAHPATPDQQVALAEYLTSLQRLETRLHDSQAFTERYRHTTKIMRLMLFSNSAATGSLTQSND